MYRQSPVSILYTTDVIGRQQHLVDHQSSELRALRFSLHNLQVREYEWTFLNIQIKDQDLKVT